MKNSVIHQKLLLLGTILLSGIFSLVAGQYYYFDTTSIAYPYRQGCSTTLNIKATTEGDHTGAKAGLLRLQLDPNYFSYATSDVASILQTQLFQASTDAFPEYTNASVYPVWIDTNKTILQIDRYDNISGSYFMGTGLYGVLRFIPKYAATSYTGIFSMIYNGDTVRTSLSYGGNNIIIPAHQNQHITGSYYIEQLPCQNDTTLPASTLVPNGGSKKSHLSGIQLTLTENAGGGSVPYVWTGGLPGVGTWTTNNRGINNQYGINFSTFEMFMSGNGDTRYFTGGMFSVAGNLIALASDKTRQFHDKNYTVSIAPAELFDYGIEKTIIITGKVADWYGNIGTISTSFNHAIGPSLIAGSMDPAAGATGLPTSIPAITLGIQDDWAGVNSGSITVTLAGINGTSYGPYIFSGSDLHLSGVQGFALQPDYYIYITTHPNLPSSGTIQVNVYAEDMVGTPDTISAYTFRTKPSCVDYGCFHDVYLQTGNTTPFIYNGFSLNVSGGINPSFTIDGNTGTLYCGMENETSLDIAKGTEEQSGTALHVSFHDVPNLVFSGASVKAKLSGNTIYLEKIYTIPTPPGGGGGGGGGGIITTEDDCKLPSELACANETGEDYSDSFYDNTCCAANTGHGAATGCDTSDSPFDEEITNAFSRGYDLNITNKCPITSARLEGTLNRIEAAKMLSMFTIQVIGIYPDTTKAVCEKYDDIAYLSAEMRFFAKTACQLDIMGLEEDGKTPQKSFDPGAQVDRAQFGTMISRLIYGDTYNIHEGDQGTYKRYEKHLKALNKDNVMKKIENPSMLEERARVLLMLKRIYDNHLVEKYRLIAPAHNGAIVLLENIR